jgi:hypothetical protein
MQLATTPTISSSYFKTITDYFGYFQNATVYDDPESKLNLDELVEEGNKKARLRVQAE